MKHKISKRLITSILCLVMLLQVIPAALVIPASAAEETRYSDVVKGKNGITTKHFDAINYMYDNGFMVGTGNGKFSPNDTLTRAMAVTVLYRLSGKKAAGTCKFQDLTEDWYRNAVVWGERTGIVKGISETEFAPYQPLQRREAITFLYRYAMKYYGDQISVTGSIDNYLDYNEIEWTDAQEAMRWAVSYGILNVNVQHRLCPQEVIDRKTFALYVHKMCTNVIGIQKSDMHYSQNRIDEIGISFTDTYLVGTEEYEELISHEKNVFLWAQYDSDWSGSCMGLALTCMLDKAGKIAFNENVSYNAPTMRSVPKFMKINNTNLIQTDAEDSDTKISLALSVVNYYQLLQYTNAFDKVVGEKKEVSTNALQQILDGHKQGSIAVLDITYGTEKDAHAIVIHGKPMLKSNGDYILRVYETGNYDLDCQFRITKDLSSCYYEYTNKSGEFKSYEISKIRRITADMLDEFDIDGPKNEMSNGARANPKKRVPNMISQSDCENTAIVSFDAYGEITIENAAGETMHYQDGVIGGDMEILNISTFSSEPDAPATYILTINKSGSYQYSTSSLQTNLVITDSQKYVSINGSGIQTVEIALMNVTVSGSAMTMELISSCGCSDDRWLRINTTNETSVSISPALSKLDLFTTKAATIAVENCETDDLIYQFQKSVGKVTIIGINTDNPSHQQILIKRR